MAGNATGANHVALSFRRDHRADCPCRWHDPQERGEVGYQGSGGGFQCGAERRVPPPQRTRDHRRGQSLGSSSGLCQAEGSRLCGRGMDAEHAGPACARVRPEGRLRIAGACRQSDRAQNPGRSTAASGEGEVLSGTTRSRIRSQNARGSAGLSRGRTAESKWRSDIGGDGLGG